MYTLTEIMFIFIAKTAVDSSPGIQLSSSSMDSGQMYSNNSVIRVRELYSNLSTSLVCSTEKKPCCSQNRGWHYPNGTTVPNYAAGYHFYTERRDDGTVRLYLRNTTRLFENTIQLCCELPTIDNLIHTLCVYLGRYINFKVIACIMIIMPVLYRSN